MAKKERIKYFFVGPGILRVLPFTIFHEKAGAVNYTINGGTPMVSERKRDVGTILVWIVIIIALCWSFFPFHWAIITSFKPPGVILTKPSLIPFVQFKLTLFNWRNEYINRGREISATLLSSFTIAGGATLVAVSLGTLAG